MIKGFLAFLVIFAICFFGISLFWYSTKKEKLDLFKLALYSTVCTAITLYILIAIVILF